MLTMLLSPITQLLLPLPSEISSEIGGSTTQWPCHCVLLSRDYADFRTALSTSVLPSDQIAPGTLWLAAMTSSNDFSIQLQSSSDHERRQQLDGMAAVAGDLRQDLVILEQRYGDELAEQALVGSLQQIPGSL